MLAASLLTLCANYFRTSVFLLLSFAMGIALKGSRHLSHHSVLIQHDRKISMVRREMKTKQKKKVTRAYIPIFSAETNKCFTAISSHFMVLVCVRIQMQSSVNLAHFFEQCTVFTRRGSNPILKLFPTSASNRTTIPRVFLPTVKVLRDCKYNR